MAAVGASCGGGTAVAPPPVGIANYVIGDTAVLPAFVVACSTATNDPTLGSLRTYSYQYPLGSELINPAGLGGTFVLTAGIFVRDTSRTGAPPDGVRFVLPLTVRFAVVPGEAGLLDIIDSARTPALRVTRGWLRHLDGTPYGTLRVSRQVAGDYTTDIHDVVVTRSGVTLHLSDTTVILTGTPLQTITLDTDVSPGGFHFKQYQGLTMNGARTFSTYLALGGPVQQVPMQLNSSGNWYLMVLTDQAGMRAMSAVGQGGRMGDLAEAMGSSTVSPALRAWMNQFDRIFNFLPPVRDLTSGASYAIHDMNQWLP